MLSDEHREHLRTSGLTDETIDLRGYRTIQWPHELTEYGFRGPQMRTPGILMPITNARGEAVGYQYRPDSPGATGGKTRKYETPPGQRNILDVPARSRGHLRGTGRPVLITEGIKKADAVDQLDRYCVIGLSGVFNWRGRDGNNANVALPDWEDVNLDGRDVYIAFDSDSWTNPHVVRALHRLAFWLAAIKRANVQLLRLPAPLTGKKQGIDDWLVDGGDPDALEDMLEAWEEPVRPVVEVDNVRDDEVTREVVRRLVEHGEVFRRGSDLVGVTVDYGGNVVDIQLNAYSLTIFMCQAMDFNKLNAVTGQRQLTRPPEELARRVLSSSQDFPALRQVVRVPVFVGDGVLVEEPGYYPEAELWYAPQGERIDVPERPTEEDVRWARELMLTSISSFTFADDDHASKTNALALMVLPFVRPMIDGPTPLHLIEASTPGSGKGKLTNAMLRPYLRGPLAWLAPPTTEEEWSKVIFAAVLKGSRVFAVDNVVDEVKSASLAVGLTTQEFEGRKLGSSENVSATINWPWVMTANNVTFSPDIYRRTLPVRLSSDVEQPWTRQPKDFVIPNIDKWVTDHEVLLTRAVLILVRAWLAAKRPAPKIRMGSYDAWSDVVGGILEHAGIGNFAGNLLALYNAANLEDEAWRRLVAVWSNKEMDRIPAERIYELVDEEGLDLRLNGRDEKGLIRSLSRALVRKQGRVYGVHRIVQDGHIPRKGKGWRLVRATEVISQNGHHDEEIQDTDSIGRTMAQRAREGTPLDRMWED